MNDKRALNVTDGVAAVLEPGDMTSYQLLAFRVHGHMRCGQMGVVKDGWLIATGMSGRAYLFPNGDDVSEDYVAEKFDLKNIHTIRHVTEQVADVIGGKALHTLTRLDENNRVVRI